MKKLQYLTILTLVFISFNLYSQNDTIEKNIYDLTLQDLMQVKIVTATKRAEDISKAPSIISSISSEQIEQLAVTTLSELLEIIPGIEVSINSTGEWRISIRGIRHSGEVLLLLNDQRINDFYTGGAIFDLPVEMIDRVEVIRGPGSSLYGTNAFSGIINIITKENHNSIKIQGSDKNAKASICLGKTYELEKDTFSFFVQGGYNYSKGYNVEIEQDIASAKLWSLTNGEKTFETNKWLKESYALSKLKYNSFEFFIFEHSRENGTYVGPVYIAAPESKLNYNRFICNLKYKWKISKKITFLPKIYADYHQIDNFIQETPEGYLGSPSGLLFLNGKITKEKYNAQTFGFENQINYNLNKYNEITAGFLIERLNLIDFEILRNYRISDDSPREDFGIYDDIQIFQEGKYRNIFASYIQERVNFERINLIFGLRYDNYSDFGSTYSPRISTLFNLNPKNTIKILYGKAFRAPTFLELYDRTNLSEDGIFGKQTLIPEFINSYELSYEFNTKNFYCRTNFFYNDAQNLIRPFDPWGDGGAGWYENIGKINSFGFENEIKILLYKKLLFSTNLSYFYTLFYWNPDVKQGRYYYDGTKINNIPFLRINSLINYSFRNININFSINYGSKSGNNEREAVEKAQIAEIPSYIQFNMKTIFHVKEKVWIEISGNNLIGKKFSDPTELNSITAFGSQGLAQPTNLFYISLIYKFKI